MDIYSPKSQQTVNFKKNTVKEKISINKKCNSSAAGTTIIFEFEKLKSSKEKRNEKKNFILEKFDLLKLKFYERLKLFFEYDEKSNENASVKQNW